MTNRPPPTLPKWIFVLADLFLLAACAWTIRQVLPAKSNFDHLVVLGGIAAWMFGAWICVKPWLEEFKAQNKHLENDTLASAVEQIQKVEEVAARIQTATGSWQSAQDSATRTAAAAREIEEKIRATTKEFIDFQERIHGDEKRHMTLEIEKLRRVEADWLQVAARMLDHTYMLNLAGQRSGQENLINQLNTFQTALRDTARRMGLVSFTPTLGERYDNRGHQTETPEAEPPAESIVTEVLATGFTFQGQLLRRALVRVGAAIQETPTESPTATSVVPELEAGSEPVEEESLATTKQETEEAIAGDENLVSESIDTTPIAEPGVTAESAPVIGQEPEAIDPAVAEELAKAASEGNVVIIGEPEASPAPTPESATEPERPRRRRKTDPQASLPF